MVGRLVDPPTHGVDERSSNDDIHDHPYDDDADDDNADEIESHARDEPPMIDQDEADDRRR